MELKTSLKSVFSFCVVVINCRQIFANFYIFCIVNKRRSRFGFSAAFLNFMGISMIREIGMRNRTRAGYRMPTLTTDTFYFSAQGVSYPLRKR